MKDFLKNTLATLVGLFLFNGILFVLAIVSLISMATAGSDKPSIKSNSVLVMNLSGTIEERSEGDDGLLSGVLNGALGLDDEEQYGLNDILAAIEKAEENNKIAGIYLEFDNVSASVTTLKEIHDALAKFKQSGKWIIAYATSYGQGEYYVASVADKVLLNPNGTVDLHGLAVRKVYVKGMLEKFGIKMLATKIGKYKSAIEPYINDAMSPEDREQNEVIVFGLWDNIVAAISEGRNLSADSINALADKYIGNEPSENFPAYGLVDSLTYSDGVKAYVKSVLGVKESKPINQVTVGNLLAASEDKKKGDEIAVYYAFGDIKMEPTSGGLFGTLSHEITAEEMCEDLNKLAEDNDVKAVVLRVNSPGGDAMASDIIWNSVCKLKAKKPVVVSMGDYAASGGYYISCAADWIVAQPTTLTGSIGVLGLLPTADGLFKDKLGRKYDGVGTNKNSLAFNFDAIGGSLLGIAALVEVTDTEEDMIMSYILNTYKKFVTRVSDGRGMTYEAIDSIAQGRVWLARDAAEIGLVDQLGDIKAAISKAAELAELEKYYTEEYPMEDDLGFFASLMSDDTGSGGTLDEQLRYLLGDMYEPFAALRSIEEGGWIQARLPYYIVK